MNTKKQCNVCKVLFPIEDFPKESRKCKQCYLLHKRQNYYHKKNEFNNSISKINNEEKMCNYCNTLKPTNDFYMWTSQCKKCSKKRADKWKNNNKDRVNELSNKYYHKNSERILKRNKLYRDKDILKYRARAVILSRKHRHGITNEEYEVILEKANGQCAICKQFFDKPCLDHDHDTGKIRGILCSKCNSGIGFLNDDVSIIENASEYLKFHGSIKRSIRPYYG